MVDIQFTDRDWMRNERDWSAWWAGELARPLVMIECLSPSVDVDPSRLSKPLGGFPLGLPAEDVLDVLEPGFRALRFVGDAFPKWWPNFGPGIAAAFLGAQVHFTPETAWFEPSRSLSSLEDVHLLYDPENMWWQRVQEITRAAVLRWGDKMVIGHTDLGGNLDILASLRGAEALLLDTIEAPDVLERLVREMSDLWLSYFDELHRITRRGSHGVGCWGPLWIPGRGYMLQSDFSYMISPKMFERFVLPDLDACCQALDYPFYHMDGKGQIPHLEMLLSLSGLLGIQWQPGLGSPPAEEWLPLLKRIRDSGKLCQVYVTGKDALAIQHALGGRGFLFVIREHGLTPEEARDLFSQLIAV